MKRVNNLFNKICTIENMKVAYRNATKGKKHYKEVIEIEKDVDGCLNKLLHELKTHTYKTSKYYIFKRITGGKEREIYKLPMRDRIVQHAIMNYIEPIFRNSFIKDTYSSIKGRGIHMGLYRVKSALKDPSTQYCLKLDIKKFYPSIDKDLLKQTLRRKFKDKELLQLLDEIVDSTDKGVPIGNYTSQYFANYFLTPMDHWIKEKLRIKYYFRYCDDIVILHKDKQTLWDIFYKIQDYLSKLKLTVKPNYQIFPIKDRGVDFLGYRIFHTHTLVRKQIKHNFIKKVKRNSLRSLGSYYGIFCHANCINLWKTYTGVKKFSDLNIKIKERLTLAQVENAKLEINSIEWKQRKNYTAVVLHATFDGRDIKVSTGSEMIVDVCKKLHKEDFPFEAMIVKSDKFYKFTDYESKHNI